MVEKTKCESWLEETTAANPQSATGNPQSKWTGTSHTLIYFTERNSQLFLEYDFSWKFQLISLVQLSQHWKVGLGLGLGP